MPTRTFVSPQSHSQGEVNRSPNRNPINASASLVSNVVSILNDDTPIPPLVDREGNEVVGQAAAVPR